MKRSLFALVALAVWFGSSYSVFAELSGPPVMFPPIFEIPVAPPGPGLAPAGAGPRTGTTQGWLAGLPEAKRRAILAKVESNRPRLITQVRANLEWEPTENGRFVRPGKWQERASNPMRNFHRIDQYAMANALFTPSYLAFVKPLRERANALYRWQVAASANGAEDAPPPADWPEQELSVVELQVRAERFWVELMEIHLMELRELM
jgi:hypothetical protein